MMKCRDNIQCVYEYVFCDGKTNCLDGSDEKNCDDFVCLPGGTKCADNLQCIGEWAVCISEKLHSRLGSWVCDNQHSPLKPIS